MKKMKTGISHLAQYDTLGATTIHKAQKLVKLNLAPGAGRPRLAQRFAEVSKTDQMNVTPAAGISRLAQRSAILKGFRFSINTSDQNRPRGRFLVQEYLRTRF
jgi:hypothetical protein